VRFGEELDLCAKILLEAEVESYCPVYKRWRKLPKHIAVRSKQTRELVKTALLDGYIFVRCDGDEELSSVCQIKGVFGFISTSVGICYARDQDIEDLKLFEKGVRKREKPRDALERMKKVVADISIQDLAGKTVRMKDGPFKGFSGPVVQIVGEDVVIAGDKFDMTAKANQVEKI
jgi:transcription antitermination factor NusG